MNYDFELIFARKRKKLTQEKLAELTGLSRATINRIERGRFRVNYEIMTKVYKAVDLEWTKSANNKINQEND